MAAFSSREAAPSHVHRSRLVSTFTAWDSPQGTPLKSLIQEGPQLAGPAWVLQLAQGFCFDLANTFAGHAELLAHLFQGVVGVHADAEPHPQNPFLARGERGQNPRGRFLEVFLNGAVQWQHGILVLDEIAQLAVFLVADWRFKADRLFGDFHHLTNFFERHLQLFSQFLGRRFAADFVQHLTAGPDQLVDRFDHVNRNTDRTRLIRDRARDRLTDPPGRIGRELIAAAIFELVHRLHQADVAFLNKIKELQAAVRVFLGD